MLFSIRANSYLELSEGESSSATAAKGGSWPFSSLLNLKFAEVVSSSPSHYNYVGRDIKSDKNPRAGLVVYSHYQTLHRLLRLPASHASTVMAGGRWPQPLSCACRNPLAPPRCWFSSCLNLLGRAWPRLGWGSCLHCKAWPRPGCGGLTGLWEPSAPGDWPGRPRPGARLQKGACPAGGWAGLWGPWPRPGRRILAGPWPRQSRGTCLAEAGLRGPWLGGPWAWPRPGCEAPGCAGAWPRLGGGAGPGLRLG